MKERLRTLGFDPVANSPAEFGERIKTEGAKWDKVAKDAQYQDRLMRDAPMNVIVRTLAARRGAVARRPAAMPRRRSYPDRPVRIIVPFAPAGPVDVVARLVGQKLTEHFGKQFFVENQAGAGGNLGMGNAAKAAPDGYTHPVRVVELRGQSEPLCRACRTIPTRISSR